ncbi:phage/plasmid replication protein [Burkholderia sp. Ed8]|uniref:phage/plasmid replication domain-containing protein n=1 Tax=Burkholderia sp. Ed8 TaxID=3112957 RepID=UPI00345DBB3B
MKTRPSQFVSPPLKATTKTLAQIGMAFRPADCVNVDTVEFTVSGIEWDVSNQTRCLVSNADGEVLFNSTNRLPVTGKYGMHNLQVRYNPITKTLRVEGSLFGFILGQNVFTSQRLAKGLAWVISYLKKKLGFSFAVPMQKLIDEHVTLHRVDLAVNLQFGSGRFVKTCLRQIARQLIEQDCMVRKAFTSVYWTPQNSRYYSIIFYDKGEDVRRKYLPKAKRTGDREQTFFEARCNECDGLLRIEVRLRSAELKKRGLQNVKAWSGDAPKEIFNRYYRNVPVLNVVSSGMTRADFDGVPDRLRPVVALHKLNAPMELVYSERTMARHRATFRKQKIDLKSPARAKVVPLAKVLTASRIKPTPTRLIDARFAPLPCEASALPSPVKGRVSRIA